MQKTTARIIVGNNIDTLRTLEAHSIQTVVTSPPYWGLRDYGTATWIGGDEDCDHKGKPFKTKANINRNMSGDNDVKNSEDREFFKSVCGKCGAARQDQQLGLEPTPDEFVENLCLVFDEVWRVLKDDGTLWLNLGDSYNGAAPNRSGQNGFNDGRTNRDKRYSVGGVDGLKPKDLVGIPWRVAFALQARGWYLRQDIIWAKPNPMPESVTDRCTKSHEYIFLLTKSAKYYFDNLAIKEPVAISTVNRLNQDIENQIGSIRAHAGDKINGTMKAVGAFDSRNKRSVWFVSTKPYKEAHFATYPVELIKPCILAGSAAGDTVLDPFSGSGTTGEVSICNGRNYIGLELNYEYAQLSMKRLSNVAGLTAEIEMKGAKNEI